MASETSKEAVPMQLEVPETMEEETFTSRSYQEDMLELCLQRNTIIFLPTGAGKTYIALMTIKRMAKDLQKPFSEGGKRSVFLCNTVVLAKQQAYWIGRLTALKTAVYTGDMNLDNWMRERWLEEFEDNQVIVATCQIVLDVIRHGYISLDQLNIIIFDECHNATKKHPMFQLMSLYQRLPNSQRPRIIGLSGSLLGANVKSATVLNDLETLERTFHAIISTVSSAKEFVNVMVYSTNPFERIVRFSSGQSYIDGTGKRIEDIVKHFTEKVTKWPLGTDLVTTKQSFRHGLVKISKVIKSLFADFVYQMHDLGMYGASVAILSIIVELELLKRSNDSKIKRQLIRQAITTAELINHTIVGQWSTDEMADAEEMIMSQSSHKLSHLLAFLGEHSRSNDPSQLKVLIFVQRRHSAKCIYHILNNYAQALGDKFPFRPDFMVGNNSALAENIQTVLENKWNNNVLDRFKKGVTNTIVCTNVLEEGVDLQMCNLVICYDKPTSYRSYVQSKGRARMENSTYVIMTESAKYDDMLRSLDEFKNIERILRTFLIGKTIDRQMPDAYNLHRHFTKSNRIEPFRTPKGALLEDAAVLQLLNRYSMSLPNDSFSKIQPFWSIGPNSGSLLTIELRLPMQSCVKDTFLSDPSGDYMEAKRSAAFKACRALYEKGELDEHLMPYTVRRVRSQISDLYFQHWTKDQFIEDDKKPAKEITRMHSITFPQVLTACTPLLDHANYMYIISTIPNFDATPCTKTLHSFISAKNSFGLLTAKLLPATSEFTLQQAFGTITVQIEPNPVLITFDSADNAKLQRLANFHNVVFDDIVDTKQPFLANDWTNMENSYLIVPTTKERSIDWATVDEFQQIKIQEHEPNKRPKLDADAADYLHRIIYPWYRVDTDVRYMVINVHEQLTPFSPFPNHSYESYAAYIQDKYQLNVVNRDQFMLEVKAIQPSMLNALKRADTKQFADRGPEMLIPEFCHNLRFPAVLWLKAMLLPSILHRLHFLLNAESIRTQLNDELCPNLVEPYVPWPIVEQKNRNPASINPEEEIKTVRSIVIPNPEDTPMRSIEKQEFVSLSSTVDSPWTATDEPIDITRNLFDAYYMELDYFHNFINDGIKGLKIIDQNQTRTCIDDDLDIPQKAAICDMSQDEKKHIGLLAIQPHEPNRGLDQAALVSALTDPSAFDLIDYRRQNILGKSFLNFAASMFLMQEHRNWNLTWLRECHSKMTSTRNLAYLGIAKKVPGMIKVNPFNPKNDWVPPRKSVPRSIQEHVKTLDVSPHTLFRLNLSPNEIATGMVTPENMYGFVASFLDDEEGTASSSSCSQQDSSMNNFIGMQRVSDEAVAASLTAIMGECAKTFGVESAGKLLKLFNVVPETAKTDVGHLLSSKAFVNARVRPNVLDQSINDLLININQLENTLDYKFKERGYLLQALTHHSFPSNPFTDCYQRLSFLGETVIDFLITAHIFERADHLSADELLDLRAALTSNIAQACYCVRHKMHLYLLAANMTLSEKITSFVAFQEQHGHRLNDQVLILIEESDTRMGEFVDVPAAVGNIFAAIVAAIFLDSGNDLVVTWNTLYRLAGSDIESLMFRVPREVVQRLTEFPGAKPKFDKPHVEPDVVMVNVRFTRKNEVIQMQGFGQNAADAKRAAAKVAMHALLQ